jgi:RNA polymerase sigma-70 factor, ECF subfamily
MSGLAAACTPAGIAILRGSTSLPPTYEITQLLKAWSAGDEHAREKLTPLVYKRLHQAAQRYMAGERPGHTLHTTALVNEIYLRLVDCGKVSWQDREHFFAVSAQRMRRILIDFAVRTATKKEAVGSFTCHWIRLQQ